MTDETFWALISRLDWKKTGDDAAVIRPVVRDLAKASVEDIFRFDDLLAEKLFALDTEAHARNIGEDAYDDDDDDDFSVDCFLYARCCVVANGRAAYQRALADPTRMFKDLEFEALLTVAQLAYTAKTKDEDYPHVPTPDYETFANQEGWKDRPVVSADDE